MSVFRPLRVLHLPLEAPPRIDREEGRGVYAVFWHGAEPLGHAILDEADLPMPAGVVLERALQAVAPTLRDRLTSDATSGPTDAEARAAALLTPGPVLADGEPLPRGLGARGPSVSVVVCTRDRPGPLAACLEALAGLAPAPDEILVVDNAPSTPASREVVVGWPGVRYVCEPRPGLDHARNRGALEATSDVVAYTDDDVEPHPAWIEGLRRGFSYPDVDAVTGLVFPRSLETEAQWRFEAHWGFHRGYLPKTYGPAFFERTKGRGAPVWEIGAGANMAFRRAVFSEVGLFDERLDVGAAGCSGDSEYWYRLLAAGRTCRYEPTAVVHHEHRRTADALRRQLRAYMRGHTAALLVQYERTGHVGNLRRLLLSLPRYYGRRSVRGLLSGFRGRERTLGAELAGAVAGVGYYVRHRRGASTARAAGYRVEPSSASGEALQRASSPTP